MSKGLRVLFTEVILALYVFRFWNRLSLPWLAVICALAIATASTGAQNSESDDAKPVVSDKPLSVEQLAIYRVILKGWMDDGKHSIHLSNQTIPLEKDATDCVKSGRLEEIDPKQVHRFRNEDLAQLGSNRIVLVDQDAQAKDVEKNDPGAAIRNGTSISEAVSNGFAHGLVTLSEIQFSEKHEVAIVWYGFTCGSLCGNGGTVVMEKKNGKWQRGRNCSNWISKLDGFLPVADAPAPGRISLYGN